MPPITESPNENILQLEEFFRNSHLPDSVSASQEAIYALSEGETAKERPVASAFISSRLLLVLAILVLLTVGAITIGVILLLQKGVSTESNGETVDPKRSITINGTTVSTVALLDKLTTFLDRDYPLPYGAQIHLKSGGKCLDGSYHIWQLFYLITPQPCTATETQQFRLKEGLLAVGRATTFPLIHAAGYTPCVEVYEERSDGELIVYKCTGDAQQHFALQIVAQAQLDFTQRRVYFSLVSQLHPTRCLTLYSHPSHFREAFYLEPCTGSEAQSFYFAELSLAGELEKMKALIDG